MKPIKNIRDFKSYLTTLSLGSIFDMHQESLQCPISPCSEALDAEINRRFEHSLLPTQDVLEAIGA